MRPGTGRSNLHGPDSEVRRSVNFARARLSYSNVIATVALFVALGGAAMAARPPAPQRRAPTAEARGGTSVALRKHAVTMAKIASNSVFAQMIADGAVTSTKLSMNAVSGPAIANGAIGTGKLGNNAVTRRRSLMELSLCPSSPTKSGPCWGRCGSVRRYGACSPSAPRRRRL